MSALNNLHDDLILCMNQVAKVMRLYEYDATPTLVLRHKDGSSYSIVLGNDDLTNVIQAINDLSKNGSEAIAILEQIQSVVQKLKWDLGLDECTLSKNEIMAYVGQIESILETPKGKQ